MSADWSSLSPGKKLGIRFGGGKDTHTIAQGGTPGMELIRRIRESDFEGRTILIAMDFLFWDSTRSETSRSKEALRTLLNYASSRKIPIVLGDIPELLDGRQISRMELNREIHKQGRETPRCFVWELDRLHRQVIRDQGLVIRGRHYRFNELVPDGLHLAEVAGDFLADQILQLLGSNGVRAP